MEERLELEQVGPFSGEIFTNVGIIEGHVTGQNLTLNSAGMEENLDEIEVGFEDSRRRNLGLRENPKKSWWVSSISMQQGSICEQCGKGFKSDKALFGHMRLHSKRKSTAVKEIVKMPTPTKRKRSERRYKINSCSNSSLSNMNPSASSSSVSLDSVDEELEDVAICLLMLGNGGFCSFYADQAFSDDVDSVKTGTNVAIESAQITDDDTHNVVEVVKARDLGCGYVSFREEITEFHGFDRGFSNPRHENPECGPSFDLNKPVFGSETENLVELHDTTEVKIEINDSLVVGCLKKLVFDSENENQAAQLYGSEIKDEVNDSTVEEISLKEQYLKKHICKICNRSFKSGQSLGGHKLHCPISRRYRPSFSVSAASLETRTESDMLIHGQKAECTTSELQGSENRLEELGSDQKRKRGRMHKCPVCQKSFSSGQALGGHMRAHFNDKLEPNDKEFDAVDHVSDPEIPVACGSKQQHVEISSKTSEAVLVGVVAGV